MKTKMVPLLTGLLLATCSLKAQQGPPGGQQRIRDDRPRMQGRPQQQPPSTEERLKHVTDRLETDLTLNPEQKQKVQDAYKAFFDGTKKLMAAREESLKNTLTADQFKKYQEIEKRMGPGGRPSFGSRFGPRGQGGPGGPYRGFRRPDGRGIGWGRPGDRRGGPRYGGGGYGRGPYRGHGFQRGPGHYGRPDFHRRPERYGPPNRGRQDFRRGPDRPIRRDRPVLNKPGQGGMKSKPGTDSKSNPKTPAKKDGSTVPAQ